MENASYKPATLLEKRELSPLQNMYVDAYFECGGNVNCISKEIDRSTHHCYQMSKAQIVKDALKDRRELIKISTNSKLALSVGKSERVDLLWSMAKRGAELIYDKEGNQVMMNPATSVSAIRTINEMLPGSLAPKEVDVNVTVEDRRTEAEIATNIATLMGKYNELKQVTDEQVAESRALPDIVIDNEESEG